MKRTKTDFKFDLTQFLKHIPFVTTRKLLAVETDEVAVRIVEIDFTRKKPTITAVIIKSLMHFTHQPGPRKISDEKLKTCIEEAIRENHLEAKEIIFLISGSTVFSRKIRIPRLPAGEVEKGIRWEASNQIPFNLENSHFDWIFLKEVELTNGTPNHEYMIAASSKKSVDGMVTIAKELSLMPLCIGIPVSALNNIIQQANQFNTSEKRVLIDMGATRTNILIAEKRCIIFSRELPWGEQSLCESVLHDFQPEGWDIVRVHNFINEKAIIPLCLSQDSSFTDSTIQRFVNILRPIVEKFFSEVRRSFDYFREQQGRDAIQMVVLSGKSNRLVGLLEAFAQQFTVAVERLDMEELFMLDKSIDDEAHRHFLKESSILLGLTLGQERQINFVPEVYKERKSKLLQIMTSVFVMTILFVLAVFLIAQALLVKGELSKKIDDNNATIDYIMPQIQLFNQKAQAYMQDKERLHVYRREQLLLAQGLTELSNLVPRSITFTKVSLEDDGWLKITGYVFDDILRDLTSGSVLTDFVLALENSPFFTKAKVESLQESDVFEVPHSVFYLSCKVISRQDIEEI